MSEGRAPGTLRQRRGCQRDCSAPGKESGLRWAPAQHPQQHRSRAAGKVCLAALEGFAGGNARRGGTPLRTGQGCPESQGPLWFLPFTPWLCFWGSPGHAAHTRAAEAARWVRPSCCSPLPG